MEERLRDPVGKCVGLRDLAGNVDGTRLCFGKGGRQYWVMRARGGVLKQKGMRTCVFASYGRDVLVPG